MSSTPAPESAMPRAYCSAIDGADSLMSRPIAIRCWPAGVPSSCSSTRGKARPIRYASASSIWSGYFPRTSYTLKIEGSVTPRVLQEAALAEVGGHAHEDGDHHAHGHPEAGCRAACGVRSAGQADVHSEDAGEQREREDDHGEGGQYPQHLVDPMREHGLVRVLERLDDLLEVLEHVPDALGGVDDVVEVDLEVLGEVALLCALQIAQHGSLRTDHLAEVDDLLLRVRDVAHDLLGAALEDLLLEVLELVPDLPQHREAVVERVVDDLVEQIAAALREHVLAHLLVGAAALE